MKIIQSVFFAKKVKKPEPKQKQHLGIAVKEIISDPQIVVVKRGDLRGVFARRFKIQGARYLLSHSCSADDLELIMRGPHENYYRALESYPKKS